MLKLNWLMRILNKFIMKEVIYCNLYTTFINKKIGNAKISVLFFLKGWKYFKHPLKYTETLFEGIIWKKKKKCMMKMKIWDDNKSLIFIHKKTWIRKEQACKCKIFNLNYKMKRDNYNNIIRFKDFFVAVVHEMK